MPRNFTNIPELTDFPKAAKPISSLASGFDSGRPMSSCRDTLIISSNDVLRGTFKAEKNGKLD
jgi:hypothetical protein